jgi:acetyl-CoA C-acetyltransferase
MAERVGIIGVGYEGFRPLISDLSARELMFEAASKAYSDADVDPRKEVGSFICCTEDLWEGWSITDEMVPDQIGGARRPVCTVPGDSISGLGHAVMQIRAGVADVVAVEAHSKAADVLDKAAVENLALDPVFLRGAGANNDVLAGLEMSAFLGQTGLSPDDCSEMVAVLKAQAMRNPRASYGEERRAREDEGEERIEPISLPLRRYDKAEFAEAGIVAVVAGERWIRKMKRDAIFIDGIAWRSSTPWYEGGAVEQAEYAKRAFEAAKKQAGLKGTLSSFDLIEADDTYSYKLLQHLASLEGLGGKGAMKLASGGRGGSRPYVNASGGSLGVGYLIEASGLHKILECVLQMRNEAGGNQLKRVERALALAWRGNPTATGAVAILSR